MQVSAGFLALWPRSQGAGRPWEEAGEDSRLVLGQPNCSIRKTEKHRKARASPCHCGPLGLALGLEAPPAAVTRSPGPGSQQRAYKDSFS